MKKHKLTGEGGKGSKRRSGNDQAYKDNWDRIFGGDRKNVNHKDETNTASKNNK